MTRPDRFDGDPLTFDQEHADLGWTISGAEPYHPQRKPRLLARILVVTIWRRILCRRRFCTWPATEEGWFCDRHDPHGPSPAGRTPDDG